MELYVKNPKVNLPEVAKGLRDVKFFFVSGNAYGDWVSIHKATGKITAIGYKVLIDNWLKRGLVEMREANNGQL